MKWAVAFLVVTCLVVPANAFAIPSHRHQTAPLRAKKDADDDEPLLVRRALIVSTLAATTQFLFSSFFVPAGFKKTPLRFIAALGDPSSKSGTNTNEWGLWREDPGPRGVFLKDFTSLIEKNNGYAPNGWIYSKNDWWLEEHGIIMPSPDFPMPPGRYLVTGGRLVTTPLTIEEDGRWSLDQGTLYDVTHLPCRSARYHPTTSASSVAGSPLTAKQSDFPVFPGAAMPEVEGCDKQDYAVLFIVGQAIE